MVLTPKESDDADRGTGFVALVVCILAIWFPAQALVLAIAFVGHNIAVAIDRHLPMDSPHRKREGS